MGGGVGSTPMPMFPMPPPPSCRLDLCQPVNVQYSGEYRHMPFTALLLQPTAAVAAEDMENRQEEEKIRNHD